MSTATAATVSSQYDQLIGLVRDANLLGSTSALLGWDQETMMPPGGLAHRARQQAQLARLSHEALVDPRVGDLLAECETDRALTADPLSATAVNIREIRIDYDKATKLPTALVEELARVSSVAQHEWALARKASDFTRFRPHLERIVELVRRKAECFGWPEGGEAWDALADLYEPGCTAAEVQRVFKPLRERVVKLLDRVLGSKTGPSNAFNELPLPIDAQERFARSVVERLGFDFDRGRLDRSTHPFCGGSHCNDVRMTSRYTETCLNDGLGSAMHECGHGMYEQGLLEEHIGTPMGQAVSLGIHESQSRLWENQVGRSRSFWTWAHGQLPASFGDAARRFSLDELYGAANIVEPGFIRVDADEGTYNLHIMVRFEIERAIVAGDLAVKDIPGVWNKLYKDYLGLDVPDDRRGCLQDIHWSFGAMGYFPTYTLGTLYAAQFFEKAVAEMPGLPNEFAAGEFGQLKKWLNRNIHAHGKRYRPGELCTVVTGKPLSADPLMRHLEGKLLPLYGG
ncbi:MAG: carboxypeptidase M32 [Phycisphaerales bacterium]|nr:carboxypeptidase M32 [Phycisphaerales bacterium]